METTTKPAPTKKELRRAAILDAAEQLVIETGGEFEISQLAKAAGISNGLAYHYFGSKDGVLEAVIDRFYGRYTDVIDKPADPEIDWRVREHARLLETVAFLYSDPFAPTAFGALCHKRAIAREFEVQRHLVENAARNIRSGQRRGQIPTEIDSTLAGAAIIGAVRSTMMAAMAMNPRPDPDKVADQIWHLIEGAVSLNPTH